MARISGKVPFFGYPVRHEMPVLVLESRFFVQTMGARVLPLHLKTQRRHSQRPGNILQELKRPCADPFAPVSFLDEQLVDEGGPTYRVRSFILTFSLLFAKFPL